ncbi:aminotransferase class I/II-fold pyridoxal phosphate-dependent enzyme [candidate division WOR-3 bacterium]|uniref:Aminotransferase class I/II-fold pyridoxal phosphate-dependent enzyme n=1 Tax=candidate division WOR-3 bacterium TaxID=2052148 RepID=A0A937XDL2_UNCW3|nr:aminotransferase class I/II-fold pyridoxal phosphate-dependent enzyme [candidate division WOR-3 bacterium]
MLRQPIALRLRNDSCLPARAQLLLPRNCRHDSLTVKTFQSGFAATYSPQTRRIPFLALFRCRAIIDPPPAAKGGKLDLFDKCRQLDFALQSARARNRFFYSRAITPAAAPLATRDGRELINLGSNNYLGLTEHPKVQASAVAAVAEYGTGSAGSRLLTGTTPLHLEMERTLAAFKNVEAVVTFSTGFMALSATVSALAGEGDFIFSDELNHASIIDGCRRSQAKTVVYRHNDLADLEAQLKAVPAETAKLIVTDGVFSMEGDICDLPGLRRLAVSHNCKLMVDDAHATGVLGRTGRGTAEHYNMEGSVDVTSGTLSKSLAALGGFSGGPHAVAEFLRYNARQSVFSASLPPSVAATVIAALGILKSEPERVERLRANARFMSSELKKAGFSVHDHGTPILPIAVGDDDRTYQAAGRLEQEGVFANPVVFPAVPPGQAIVRISLMATHTEEQLQTALQKFVLVGKELHII